MNGLTRTPIIFGKCTCLMLILLGTGFSSTGHAAASASNLVVNGDAETKTTRGWSGTFPPVGIQSVESDDVFEGSGSFKVIRTDPAKTAFQFMGTDVLIEPIDSTKTYRLSFHYKVVKINGDGFPAVWLSEFLPAQGEIDHRLPLNPKAVDWTSFSKTIGPVETGADLNWRKGSTRMQILFFAVDSDQSGTGVLLFDNVSFELIQPTSKSEKLEKPGL